MTWSSSNQRIKAVSHCLVEYWASTWRLILMHVPYRLPTWIGKLDYNREIWVLAYEALDNKIWNLIWENDFARKDIDKLFTEYSWKHQYTWWNTKTCVMKKVPMRTVITKTYFETTKKNRVNNEMVGYIYIDWIIIGSTKI